MSNIIKEKNVHAKIIEIRVDYLKDRNRLEVKLELISGKHVGETVFDHVSNQSNHKLNWKYHKLRNSAGLTHPCSYTETLEDIKNELINKTVIINLSEFKYENYQGEMDSCQSVKYKDRLEISFYNSTMPMPTTNYLIRKV